MYYSLLVLGHVKAYSWNRSGGVSYTTSFRSMYRGKSGVVYNDSFKGWAWVRVTSDMHVSETMMRGPASKKSDACDFASSTNVWSGKS